MRFAKKHYLEILQIELKDLQEDIELLIERTNRDKESGRITERVAMENTALYENEILGVKEFSQMAEKIRPDDFDSLDAMIEHLKNAFKAKVKALALAEAITICIERKLEKVARYVTQ